VLVTMLMFMGFFTMDVLMFVLVLVRMSMLMLMGMFAFHFFLLSTASYDMPTTCSLLFLLYHTACAAELISGYLTRLITKRPPFSSKRRSEGFQPSGHRSYDSPH
jgi:hypothetical protein